MSKKKARLRRCNRTGKIIFRTELEAKIVLASRQYRDKGEKRIYSCHGHYHLTSREGGN